MPMRDHIKEKGYLALGSRFRRLGERLQSEVQELAQSEGIAVPASLFPTLGVIENTESLSVGDLAEALGISQPGATRNINQLVGLGLVETVESDEDRRAKRITLTRKGKALVTRAKTDLWPRVEKAVSDMCRPLDGSLLDMLAGIEQSLDTKPLHKRAAKTEKSK
jgi:DNA-binding MarR family transcriptional regulator